MAYQLKKKNFYSEYDESCMFILHHFELCRDLSAFFIEIYSVLCYHERNRPFFWRAEVWREKVWQKLERESEMNEEKPART